MICLEPSKTHDLHFHVLSHTLVYFDTPLLHLPIHARHLLQEPSHAVAGHSAVLADGVMVVIGGVEAGGRLSPRVLRYSLEEDSWEVLSTGAFGPPGMLHAYYMHMYLYVHKYAMIYIVHVSIPIPQLGKALKVWTWVNSKPILISFQECTPNYHSSPCAT